MELYTLSKYSLSPAASTGWTDVAVRGAVQKETTELEAEAKFAPTKAQANSNRFEFPAE